jgi:hypothetical protein
MHADYPQVCVCVCVCVYVCVCACVCVFLFSMFMFLTISVTAARAANLSLRSTRLRRLRCSAMTPSADAAMRASKPPTFIRKSAMCSHEDSITAE